MSDRVLIEAVFTATAEVTPNPTTENAEPGEKE